jgi:hypothetical protein
MLHTLFFVFSLVTDSQLVADAMDNGSLLGLANAGVLCLAGIGVFFRNWIANRRAGQPLRAAA